MARRCFFSFHYQDVIEFRANVVRKHNVVKDDNGGFFDASLWESAKKTGVAQVKSLIDKGLENTSATAVLIGSFTYSRRWVRYEIIKSVARGNLLIGIHINGIPDVKSQIRANGADPFDHLGLTISADGKTGTPIEWNGNTWVTYGDLEPFPISLQPPEKRGGGFKLSHWFPTYDWIANNGYQNFGDWIA